MRRGGVATLQWQAYMYRICPERGAQSGCPKSLLLGGPMNGTTLLGAFRLLTVLRVLRALRVLR